MNEENCVRCWQKNRIDDIENRVREQEVKFATVNTKLNVLIGILSAIGVSILSVVVKLLFT